MSVFVVEKIEKVIQLSHIDLDFSLRNRVTPTSFSFIGETLRTYLKLTTMVQRTYEINGREIEKGEDLSFMVNDKRREWRGTPAKSRRRQRRYEKRLTKELSLMKCINFLD
tara:strand:- start:5226 stop:5558 length:333 start_codon:yes stop_codon:yes gene_type:complete